MLDSLSPDQIISIADIIISILWLIAGLIGLMSKRVGSYYLLGVMSNGSILFISLVAVLVLRPIIEEKAIDIKGLAAIICMSLFFIIPVINYMIHEAKKS